MGPLRRLSAYFIIFDVVGRKVADYEQYKRKLYE